MPLIKVELARGMEKGYLLELQNTVLDAAREALQLPEDDRNIRVVEHDPDLFVMKPPYQILVEITLFSGRSKEVKKELFRQIVDKLHGTMGIAQETVFFVLHDQPLENWGLRGGIPADELKLSLKTDVGDCFENITAIRPAELFDLPGTIDLIRSSARHLTARGIDQWDNIYPDWATIAGDIERRELFLLEREGKPVAVITVNEHQEPEYLSADWGYPGKALVVHRLAVDPNCWGRGLGRELMRFSHEFARKSGYDTIRLDAFSGNPAAVALYERLGYRRAGSLHFRKGEFFCYELEVK